MKILHTSDWHLGRALFGRKRYDEQQLFLDWLAQTLYAQQVDVLLVAGDIFDHSAPSNQAQGMYFRFLRTVVDQGCRHVVVIAGNHDSASFVDAPREVLATLNIHVVGRCSDNPADEVLLLHDHNGTPMLIVCAVPYLRDQDIRTVSAGETPDDKACQLQRAVCDHYAAVFATAETLRCSLSQPVPVVAMGHLFAAGGLTQQDDGVRELYVGSLAHIPASIFPSSLDYVALGHLHVPQPVGGRENVRYSGSPLAMGFSEARQQKSVCLLRCAQDAVDVELLPVPVFQRLERISGDMMQIETRIRQLRQENTAIWLEVIYSGAELITATEFNHCLDTLAHDTALQIISRKNMAVLERTLAAQTDDETLQQLDPLTVFERCLDAHDIAAAQREPLRHSYRETLALLEAEATAVRD